MNFSPSSSQHQGENEILCGLIFCASTITAKTLFTLLCEMSRSNSNLSFLNVQYTIGKSKNHADTKEAEAEHRKQEEVLKKFRMHECNLLITTSILEEGFDLPKCNLVVRFDEPVNYRSYVQCKGRAKAAAALHAILVSPKVIEVRECDENRYVCDILEREEEKDENEEEKVRK